LIEANKRVLGYEASVDRQNEYLFNEVKGVLAGIRQEIESGTLVNISTLAQAEVFADITEMAQHALDENYISVASVLASAALEDYLKTKARANALEVDESDMSKVISALKRIGALKGPQAKLVQSFVPIRNKSFHANWEKIEPAEVASLIAFVRTSIIGENA